MISKNEKTFLKKKLPLYIKMASSVSLMVGAMGVSTHIYAADSSIENTEEIVITGQRKAIENAQATKRNSEVIVDSISAVDIGALPDRSVSEALQRIPGVQLQRTNENHDPARLASEGGAVFIRGLSWVRTELNGRDIFSANNGRSLGFEDVSADLMAGIDVYKSPSANLVEGGIGGTVNLRTRLPFDSDKKIIAGSIDYNYADLYEKGFSSGNALYSDSWETDAGKFGLLLSASVGNIGNRTDSIQTGRYEAVDKDGDTNTVGDVYMPTALGARRVDWDQKRTAYNAALQWAPSDELTLTAQVMRAEANPKDVEHAVGIYGDWGGNMTPSSGTFQYDSNNMLESGTWNNVALSDDTRYGNRDSITSDYSIGFVFTPDDHWKISGDLQYVDSTSKVLSMTAYTGVFGAGGVTNNSDVNATFDFSGSPSLNVSGGNRLAMQDQYYWGAAMDHIEDNEADSWASRLDAEYSFDDGFVRSFAFGARITDKSSITRQSGYNWSLLSAQTWGGGTPIKLTEMGSDQVELITYDNFFRGNVDVPAVGWFPTESLVSSNVGAYKTLGPINVASNAGWGWAPLIAPGAYDLNPQGDNVSAGINNQSEKTNAIYGVIRFGDEGDMLGKPFDGNIGLRIVQTDTEAVGRSVAGGVGESCATSNPETEACLGAKAFVSAFNSELSAYKTYDNTYTTALPSFNLRYKLQDDLQLRFGLSRTMVRPSFSQTRPYNNLSFSFTDDEFNANLPVPGTQGTGTASAGLKPTMADNFDTSLEWYFADQGSLTFAAFYKSIKDYVMASNDVEAYTYGGKTYNFEVTHQINGSSGKLKGFEIAYQQFFDKLPGVLSGLGVQSNFTYIDNQGGANTALNIFETAQLDGGKNSALPLEGMSRTSYNLALMYEKYGVSARLAYNWRERYLLTTSAANINRPVWSDDFGQLDGSVFYTINEHVKVGLQATNLLNSQTKLEVGDTERTGKLSWTDTDRRIAFVVRGQF